MTSSTAAAVSDFPAHALIVLIVTDLIVLPNLLSIGCIFVDIGNNLDNLDIYYKCDNVDICNDHT